jgi:hypothetical protein
LRSGRGGRPGLLEGGLCEGAASKQARQKSPDYAHFIFSLPRPSRRYPEKPAFQPSESQINRKLTKMNGPGPCFLGLFRNLPPGVAFRP